MLADGVLYSQVAALAILFQLYIYKYIDGCTAHIHDCVTMVHFFLFASFDFVFVGSLGYNHVCVQCKFQSIQNRGTLRDGEKQNYVLYITYITFVCVRRHILPNDVRIRIKRNDARVESINSVSQKNGTVVKGERWGTIHCTIMHILMFKIPVFDRR